MNTFSKSYQISEKIVFLGEIPRVTNFESKNTMFVLEDGTPNVLMDDDTIALLLEEGWIDY